MIYEITDYFGNRVPLRPRVELYSVKEALMGKEMPGLAIALDEVSDEPDLQYAVLTVSFGEHIGIKNAAYIDTNNCSFARQLLDKGIAIDTGLTKNSGFCSYPLWVFDENFLREHGSENYEKYSEAFDEYQKGFEFDEDDEDMDDEMTMGGI